MIYITFLTMPFLLYIVGAIWMGRRFYHQANADGVYQSKALSGVGFGLSAFLATLALWEVLSVTGKLEHVLSVTGAVVVGLTTQWIMSKWYPTRPRMPLRHPTPTVRRSQNTSSSAPA